MKRSSQINRARAMLHGAVLARVQSSSERVIDDDGLHCRACACPLLRLRLRLRRARHAKPEACPAKGGRALHFLSSPSAKFKGLVAASAGMHGGSDGVSPAGAGHAGQAMDYGSRATPTPRLARPPVQHDHAALRPHHAPIRSAGPHVRPHDMHTIRRFTSPACSATAPPLPSPNGQQIHRWMHTCAHSTRCFFRSVTPRKPSPPVASIAASIAAGAPTLFLDHADAFNNALAPFRAQ
jgi:hypothetical protein